MSTKLCDIVEEIVEVRLADAKVGSKAKCKLDIGSDSSRLVFAFEDMDADNAKKC